MARNDFSKMNGGFFPPHVGHLSGNTADGSFPGYSNRDTAAAATLLAGLAPVADRADHVYVAFTRTAGNRFWEEIRDKRLGLRCAREVIKPDAAHKTWFDLRLGTPTLPPRARSSCWPENVE